MKAGRRGGSIVGAYLSLTVICGLAGPGLSAPPSRWTIDTTSGVTGTTVPDQSVNGVRATDVTVLGGEELLVYSVNLDGCLHISQPAPPTTVGVRIYDSDTQELVASRERTFWFEVNCAWDYPISALLQPGRDYRIGWFIDAGASPAYADMFRPDSFPYWETEGLFRINGGYAAGADVFPSNASELVPPTELEVAQGFVYGDANLNGCVDGLDYSCWSLNYLSAGGWVGGDFNFDGITDGLDYNNWSLHYGYGCPWAGAGIPEPSCTVVLILAVWTLRRRR
ncbi:MAG: hypothetical protein AMJ81_11735 [Phycisphaerae bacterium SM23_33]|nr:MAG: hypothetical protein AMJ81_11735 [Phycisphaerae bacterium SM23_33]